MDTLADYENWKSKQQKSSVGAATVVLGGVDTQPDQLAGDLNLANEFGKVTGNPVPPAPMVQEYRSVFQQAIEKTRAETILSSSPRLTEWLRNPENATLAKDDLDGLSWWETGLGASWNSMRRAGVSVPQTYNQALALEYAQDAADLDRGFGEILYDERTPVVDENGKELGRAWASPGDLFGAAWRYYDSRIAGGLAALGVTDDPAKVAAGYQMQAEQLRQKIGSIPMSPGAQAVREKLGTIGGSWQEQLSQFGSLIAEDPLGFTSFIGQVGLESVPSIAISTAVGVATRNPTVAAATMGALSGAREYGSSAGDVVAEAGYDLTTPEGALAAISDETLMRRAAEVGQARAVVIGVLDGLSGGLAGKVLSSNPVGNMLLQTLTQAVFGSAGEGLGQFAAGQDLKLADILIEGLAEAFTAPAEVAGMGISKVREMQGKARDAEGRVTLFQELSGQAVNSKLRARMPDRFRQFVDQATANGPVENVFVPAQDFVQYFQTTGIDPYALVDELDGVTRDDLDAALAGGGDLKIPTATYAAKIAGSEHDAFLMENMRFDPLDMTALEAAEFNARVDDIMQEMWAEAEDIRQEDERWRAVEEQIHDQVVSQMRAAGLSTERAMAEVQPIVAFYRTRAARMGLTTEEYLAKNPLPGIQGAIPQGMQFKNVDDLNRTLAEARRYRGPEAKGSPLLEWIADYGGINDVGGELRARNLNEVKRGRGKKTLRLARPLSEDGKPMMSRDEQLSGKKFGWDDVAQAAVDAGFMADDPRVIAWQNSLRDGTEAPDLIPALIDAIDAENSVNAEVEPNYLDDIEAYLNRLGLDLNNTDDEIRAAIEADQASGDRMYGQDGALIPDSPAFKAWFGDSKVVNEDGSPKVVYHGTNAEIEAFSSDFGGSGASQRAGRPSLGKAGFYFTADKDHAAIYGDEVIEGYLSLQNPTIIDAEKILDQWNSSEFAGKYSSAQAMVDEYYDGDLYAALNLDDLSADAVMQAANNGNDGVIINTGDLEMDGNKIGGIYIALQSTQIKSVFNRGTFDPNDARVLYQGAQATDQPLYVVHNLSADKLRHAAKLGGLAAPSLAVARGDIGFDDFGEISLIGDPSLANPKTKGVRLFNADVYSPRQPRARFKVDQKAARALNAALSPVAEKLDLPFDSIRADEIERDGLSAIEGQMIAKAAWLDSVGMEVPVVREAPEPAPVSVPGFEAFVSTDWYELRNDPAFADATTDFYRKMVEDRRAVNAALADKIQARYFNEDGTLNDDRLTGQAQDVARRNLSIRNYKPMPSGRVDKYRTSRVIDEAVGPRIGEFNGWVRENFGGVVTDMFFENEAGRKKDYTLSNLVREMTRTIRNGENWNYGAGNVRAAVAPEFKSLAEVKAARGQITDSTAMEALKDEVNNELFALADKFAAFAGSEGRGFGWGDTFSEFLRDVAKGPRAVAQWPWAGSVPDDLMAEAVGFLEKLKGLPTNYFEIKMQRAMDFSEFTAALIPAGLPADARKILTDAGLELIEYQKGDDGAGRNAALQQIGPKVFFQPAYHGTPHLFEKFSLSGIGTGEGNQAYGWGLYFAGRKEVAEWYRSELTARKSRAVTLEKSSLGGWRVSVEGMGSAKFKTKKEASAFAEEQREQLQTKGRLFQVEIPEDTELLDWDAPLSKQPEAVREKLAGLGFAYDPAQAAQYDDQLLAALFDDAAAPTEKAPDDPTGQDLYRRMIRKYGSDRAASEALRAAGIPGHRYLDGGSRADGDGSRNYVIYDDSRVQVSSFEQGPRGQIQFNMDGSSLIRLFETANLSTLQHEMGHLFLTMLQRDAASGDTGSVAEYETVKSWWRSNAAAVAADGNKAMPDAKLTAEDVLRAIDIGTTGDLIKDGAIDVGMQEQWARGYEAYLMEGKAPSVELRGAFEKFRSWLISVYKSMVGLNVKISDDIRGVFDRMLATDEEIAKAKRASGEGRAVFTTAEQMGLTQEEFERFQKLRVQAEDEAKMRLQKEIMAPIQRQKEQWFRDEKQKVTEETERQINALPVFRAIEWLGNRRWLGGDAPEAMPDMRMSKQVLVDRYGEGVLKTLPRGMQTVYAVEGGMDPDDVAGWFGFDSGDQMIRAMERAPKRGDAIKAEVDRVMYERHGDALNDGEIEAIARDVLHSDKRGEWMAAELKAVAEVAGVNVNLTLKDARATARQTVARMKVRDAVAANRFLAAERKAGEEAARLGAMLAREKLWADAARRKIATKAKAALRDAGTVDAVAGQIEKANASTGNYNETVQRFIDAKRRQLMNHALFMEARAVAEEVEKAEGFVKRLNKATMREKIAGAGRRENAQMDYLSAIDEILDRYDFRKMSGRAEQRRGALLAFVDAMKAAGRENELAIPEAVLRDAAMKPYKTLSVEEMRGVVDSLKNLQHIALRWNDLIDAQNKRKLDEAIADITAAFDANLPKRPPGRVKTTAEGLRNSARQFIDLVLNAGTILREIDGFKDMGATYANLKAPIDQAMDRLTVRKEKAAADMDALYAVYSKEDRRRMAVREYVPALGYSLSKWEKIAVALNTGNEGNMQRLTDPKVRGSLTEAQVRAVLATLDERDADFVQSVWDYVGSFRDDIAAREKRATGVEPQWVEPAPVQIAGKTLRGGYYPLKYDPRLSSLARDDEAQAIGEALQAGRFGKAQTKRGHLEARAQSSGRDVELDMSVLHRHVNQVIYDLELSEPVSNSWKLLQSGDVRQAFMDAGRQADFDALETWLKDVAEGQLAAGDWINKNARRFKSNFTAAKLAFNLGTVMAQVTGLSQTMVVVGKKDFVRGVQMSFQRGIGDQIAAKSPFMRQRQTTFNKDVMDFYNDPALGPTASRWGEIKREWIGPASFWLMTKVQWLLVDIPTWLGGYQQGLRMYGNDEAKAVAHADSIVKRAQASGLFSDRSAIERGSVSRTTRQNDVIRLFTTLGSYMFAKFNVAYERGARGSQVIRQEGLSVRSVQEAASMTLDMAFLFTLEAVVMAALRGRLPDEEDDEDGDGTGDEWAAFLAKETAFSVLGTIPFVRDVVSVGGGFEGGGAYGGITAELAKPFTEVSQGEIDKGMVKSVISATGLFLGLPSSQINRAVDAGWRQAEGEDVAPIEYLLGKRGN